MRRTQGLRVLKFGQSRDELLGGKKRVLVQIDH